MNSIKINEHVKNLYPSAVFGSLLVLNVPNKRQDKKLEERKIQLKNDLENNIKKSPNDELILHHYKTYFKRWNKSYPVDFQIQSIRKGKNLPQVSVLVDSMFHAELKNVILTSGHNVDELNGDLEFDISTGDEQYIKIDGNFQQLKEGDILLHDNKDILANILYGFFKAWYHNYANFKCFVFSLVSNWNR